MALFDETIDDLIDALDETANDLETVAGVFYDRLGDDESAADDTMFAGMDLDIFSSDVLSIDPDAVALAASYQYNLSDLIVLADSTFVETSFNTDNIEINDQVLISRVLGVAASDTIALTDAVASGFIYTALVADSIATTDVLALAVDYNRELGETLVLTDSIHTWMAEDGILDADFEGSADLRAVLMKKKTPAIPAGAPPRVVLLPRTPPVRIEHNVVDPNPPRRNNR